MANEVQHGVWRNDAARNLGRINDDNLANAAGAIVAVLASNAERTAELTQAMDSFTLELRVGRETLERQVQDLVRAGFRLSWWQRVKAWWRKKKWEREWRKPATTSTDQRVGVHLMEGQA